MRRIVFVRGLEHRLILCMVWSSVETKHERL